LKINKVTGPCWFVGLFDLLKKQTNRLLGSNLLSVHDGEVDCAKQQFRTSPRFCFHRNTFSIGKTSY
jgi:hypothetical protein